MVPDIDLGLKSVLFVELVARGANADIHSLNAPLLPPPAWELVRALNTLVDANRRILIDGWYEGLWELGEEEMEQLEANAARLDLEQAQGRSGASSSSRWAATASRRSRPAPTSRPATSPG